MFPATHDKEGRDHSTRVIFETRWTYPDGLEDVCHAHEGFHDLKRVKMSMSAVE